MNPNNQIRPPLINSRQLSSRSSANFLDKSLSNSFEDPLNSFSIRKQPSFSKNVPSLAHQSSLKGATNLYKTDPNLLFQLLEKYSQANLYYRDEEFSQQGDFFITKIATDRIIPEHFKAKFPIYQILVSLSKIFMLNEFEIVAFACMLERLNWNVGDVVTNEEAKLLKEFPSNFGLEIETDCKKFIIYMLITTFSLKQFLGEKVEVDQIQAYCEHICSNFQTLYNKWLRVSPSLNRFNFSITELNRKFRHLAKRDLQGFQSSIKDFNMIVDEIMGLTGHYMTRTKTQKPVVDHGQSYEDEATTQARNPKQEIFHNFSSYQPQFSEPRSLYQGTSITFPEDRSISRMNTYDMLNNEPSIPNRVPSFIANMSRQPSFSNFLFESLSGTNRQPPAMESYEEYPKKRLKGDEINNMPMLQNQPSFFKDMSSLRPPDLQPSFSSMFRSDDIENIAQPPLTILSKKASNISQGDDLPNLSRFNSSLSFLYDKQN